jgi:recombination protein RecA
MAPIIITGDFLDLVLGGGLPSGIVELFGESSSGKTTLSAYIVSVAQHLGFVTGVLPTEYWDHPLWKNIGVDMELTTVLQGHNLDTLF